MRDKFLCVGSVALVADDEGIDLEGLRRRILEVMAELGLSRRAWSLKAGRSPAHISMILRGEVGDGLTYATLKQLAAAVGVTTDWLASGREPKYPEKTASDRLDLQRRYPNLVEALRRLGDQLLPATRLAYENPAMHHGEDLSVGGWIDKLFDYDKSARRQAKTGDSIRSRPLPDEDDTPKAGRR